MPAESELGLNPSSVGGRQCTGLASSIHCRRMNGLAVNKIANYNLLVLNKNDRKE